MVTAMASVEMDSVLLRLREGDHVGVLKRTLKGGTELVRGIETITTAATIPAGHKIALKPVANGEPVRKYGQIIGFAEGDIAEGEQIHSHNLVCRDYERQHRFCADYRPTEFYPQSERRTFQGFSRPGDRAGTRNYVAVISNVNCSNSVSR